MNLTEISKIKSMTCKSNIIIKIKQLLIKSPEEPRRVKSKCPAIILAVRRIANVSERIINLTNLS